MPPGAGQRGQAGHRARRIAAAAHALHAVVQADGRGPGGAVVTRQGRDLFLRNAADLRRTRRRPLQRAFAQGLPAQGVPRDVVVVQPVVDDQLVHQRQGQCRIRAGAQGDVLVAFVGGFCLARVDAHQPRAVALGLLRKAPEMQVAGNRVAAPDQDQLCLRKKLHLHADLAAQRLRQAFAAGGGADGAVQQ